MPETTRLPIFKTDILLEPLEAEISSEKFSEKLCLLPTSLLRAPFAEHGAQHYLNNSNSDKTERLNVYTFISQVPEEAGNVN